MAIYQALMKTEYAFHKIPDALKNHQAESEFNKYTLVLLREIFLIDQLYCWLVFVLEIKPSQPIFCSCVDPFSVVRKNSFLKRLCEVSFSLDVDFIECFVIFYRRSEQSDSTFYRPA